MIAFFSVYVYNSTMTKGRMKGFTNYLERIHQTEFFSLCEIIFEEEHMKFYHTLSLQTKNLNQNENEILNYCIKNVEKIQNIKIQQLADALYTSPATIVRFCKKLGFHGFAEFKAALKMECEQGTELEESHSSDFFADINKTMELINEGVIDKVITQMHHANRIEIYAVGSSRMVANELAKKLQSIGKLAFSYDDSSLMNVSATQLTSDDMVIALSTSGESSLILSAVSKAKSKGAKIISITDIGSNTQTKISDITLYVTSTSFVKSNISIKSRVQLLILAEYIFFRYLEGYFEENEV